jgi:hypothetical protein
MFRSALTLITLLGLCGIAIGAPAEKTYYGARYCPSPSRLVKVTLTTQPWLNNAKGVLNVAWYRGSEISKEWQAAFHVSKTPGLDDSKLVVDETIKGAAPEELLILAEMGKPAWAKGICDEQGIQLGNDPHPDPNYWPSPEITETRELVMATHGEPCKLDGSPRQPRELELTGATNNYIWRKICGPGEMHSMGFNMQMLAGMYTEAVTFSVNGSQCIIHVGGGGGKRDLVTLFLYLDGNYHCDQNNGAGQCNGTARVGIGDATNGSVLKPFFDAMSITASAGKSLSVASQVAWDDDACRWQGTAATVDGKLIR